MKQIIILILLMISVTIIAESNDPFIGLWSTKDDDSIVEIYKTVNNEYLGKIVWLKDPFNDDGTPVNDAENPNIEKQNLPLIGLEILNGFTVNLNSTLKDGTVYDPENGKTYKCTIKKKKSDLIIRGFIGISILGRSEKWIKCSSIPAKI